MLYRPDFVQRIWDTWLYYEGGVHYLFTLHSAGGEALDGISLSISTDGVRFSPVGVIIEKRPDAQWLGTGSTWRVGDGYCLNFSECREGVQSIFIARSDDLRSWRAVPDSEIRPDPRWYDITPEGRWDCIWVLNEGGRYRGYLTAVPTREAGLSCASVGCVESLDGVHFSAVPPPEIRWGALPPMNVFEVGAVERIGQWYHLLINMNENQLGSRARSVQTGLHYGMYDFVSESPAGPFEPNAERFCLMRSRELMTHFARFYRAGEEMLLCHHACEQTEGNAVYLAPLKRVCARGRALELMWWGGNDALYGERLPVDLRTARRLFASRGAVMRLGLEGLEIEDMPGGVQIELDGLGDAERGAILSGSATAWPAEGRFGAVSAILGHALGRTAFFFETRGILQIGPMSAPGVFDGRDSAPLRFEAGRPHGLRLLIRRSLVEVYFGDAYVQGYSLPAPWDGRVGFALEGARASLSQVALHQMAELRV